MATKAMAVSRTKSFESICEEIHDSFVDEKLLAQVLVSLSQLECRKVRETYIKIYGDDLVQLCLKSNRGISLIFSLMLSPFERDADVAREALHQNNTVNYQALVEIYTCRKSSHVLLIQQAYRAKYRSQLDRDIATFEPPHPHQKILVALSASHKSHHADISQHIAKCDAKRLYETGEAKRRAIDEGVILEIFSKRTIAQLKLTFSSYKLIYGHSYTSILKSEDFGGIEEAVRFVAKCIISPPKYYAKVMYGCLKVKRTRDIIRIMVSRAEVDMDEIQGELKKKYGVELQNVICDSIPQGIDRDFLVALATKNSTC